MTIPHIDTIRAHREVLAANAGAEELLAQVEQVQTILGMMRSSPADELPGDDALDALAAWPGLESLRAADAPESAPWPKRVQARELAFRGAAQLLRPAAEAASEANHQIHHLRLAQFEFLASEPALADTHQRVQRLNEAYLNTRGHLYGLLRRAGTLDPVRNLIRTYTGQITTALAAPEPNRATLVEAFTHAAVEGLGLMLDSIGVPHALSDDDPQALLAAMADLDGRMDTLQGELHAEADETRAKMEAIEAEIEALLG